MRSALGCTALGVLLLVVAGTFDAEPLYVTGAALVLLGAGAAAWIGLGAWGATIHRTVAKRSVVEEEPLAVVIEAVRGRLPLPPGWIDEPLLPEPVRLTAGRSRARVRAEVTFGRRGRRVLAPPGARAARPVRAGAAGRDRRRTPTRCSCSRACCRSARPRAGERASARTRAPRWSPPPRPRSTACASTARARPRRGSTGRRVARGAGLMERKLISEADSRPLVVLDPRAPASQDALDASVRAGRLAHRPLRAQDRLRAAAARRPPRGHDRPRPAGLAAGARAAGADGGHDRPGARRPRRTGAAWSCSSPRAWSTGRRAGSAGRRAAA